MSILYKICFYIRQGLKSIDFIYQTEAFRQFTHIFQIRWQLYRLCLQFRAEFAYFKHLNYQTFHFIF